MMPHTTCNPFLMKLDLFTLKGGSHLAALEEWRNL